ncbi:MAG: MBL fold metallo-hydrolase [Lachnospiraceae bacterium]|nr:MBL fold metallo-hydrolase [Lachnospiraceae bacterium]
MILKNVEVGYLGTNCYILHNEGSEQCIVVDPGDEKRLIFEAIEEEGLRPAAIILTHGHFDHINEIPALKERYPDVKVYCLDEESEVLGNDTLNSSRRFHRATELTPDEVFHDGDELEIAGIRFKVIATPGHTKGSCCFYFPEDDVLLSGDTLFYESIGRSDFPTGNGEELIRSITGKLYVLPEKTKVYPGHGDVTSIAHEKAFNPFTREI